MELIRELNEVFWGYLVAGILLCTGLFYGSLSNVGEDPKFILFWWT